MPHPRLPRGTEGNFEAINFGVRLCQVCDEEIEAPELGRHVIGSHDPAEIERKWEKGIQGFLASLKEYLNQSLEIADGHPAAQDRLRGSLSYIESIQKWFGMANN